MSDAFPSGNSWMLWWHICIKTMHVFATDAIICISFFSPFFANKSTEDKQQQKVHKRYHTDCHRKSKYLKCLSDAHNEQRICMWHVGCGWMLHVACCCCVYLTMHLQSLASDFWPISQSGQYHSACF